MIILSFDNRFVQLIIISFQQCLITTSFFFSWKLLLIFCLRLFLWLIVVLYNCVHCRLLGIWSIGRIFPSLRFQKRKLHFQSCFYIGIVLSFIFTLYLQKAFIIRFTDEVSVTRKQVFSFHLVWIWIQSLRQENRYHSNISVLVVLFTKKILQRFWEQKSQQKTEAFFHPVLTRRQTDKYHR